MDPDIEGDAMDKHVGHLDCNAYGFLNVTDFTDVMVEQDASQVETLRAETVITTTTGRARLIRSHSSAKFCFKLSGNSN